MAIRVYGFPIEHVRLKPALHFISIGLGWFPEVIEEKGIQEFFLPTKLPSVVSGIKKQFLKSEFATKLILMKKL